MGFYLSPSVNVRELDLTNTVPASSTSTTAMVGAFQWGPCFERTLVTSEKELVEIFGEPNDTVCEHWFSAANFLSYGSTLYVVRAVEDDVALNAGIKTLDDTKTYITMVVSNVAGGSYAVGNTITGAPSTATAKILKLNSATNFLIEIISGTFTASDTITNGTVTADVDSVTADTNPYIGTTGYIPNSTTASTYSVTNSNTESLAIFAKYPGTIGNSVYVCIANSTDFASATTDGTTLVSSYFDYSPSTTEIAVLVKYDDVIREKYILSLVSGTKDDSGNVIYVDDYTQRNSQYILMYRGGATETPPSLQWTALTGGVNSTPANADFQIGWDLFANVDTVTIDICIDGGTVNDTMQKYIIDNIALVRKDCIVICNCLKADVVGATASAATSALVTYASATLNRSTNYAALYSNWKYQYDRYADKYRWIPISGDIAGVIARTDFDRDPWFAPAGFNRGAIKNYSKLAYAPNRAQRDTLYKNRINPVLEIAGQGAIILGQKTLQTRPSAFDRLTVRRLFLILERNIQQMAQFFMFEKNNDRTRSQFVSTVTPYLERIKGAEGIYDYAVICDSSNNGSSVVDANQFIADIYIKPAKDVEFIELNFVAVGTNVEFSEIVKQ